MDEAAYVVIRYLADAARNEPVNVGILTWIADLHDLTIDRGAVARVVRENPKLHADSLLGLEDLIRETLGLHEAPPAAELRERLAVRPGMPLIWTEPRFTTVRSTAAEDLHATTERLLDRVVKPHRRSGRGAPRTLELLEREVRHLIARGSVHQNHMFHSTRTGVDRRVDLFANSGSNVAVDWLHLVLKRADEVRLRADAEANKVADILSRNDIRMVVLADFPADEEMQPVADEARAILGSVNARIVTTIDEAVQVLGGTQSQTLPG